MSNTDVELREKVRIRYAEAASTSSCCGPVSTSDSDASCCGPGASCGSDPSLGADLTAGAYSVEEIASIPTTAADASLGCGNPTAVADLREGETVLDLGSGGGIDVLLSAKRVGPTGFAYGLDMTEEMLDLARRNALKAGAANVEFLKGYIEEIPLPDNSVDVIISNCVINLSTDKPAVFAEMHRVLRPGGRIGISDVVAHDGLTPQERMERGSWVGCIAGALSHTEYESHLKEAGFVNVTIKATHQAADGMDSAIIRADLPPAPPIESLSLSDPGTGYS